MAVERIESITRPIFHYLLFRMNTLAIDADRRSFGEIRSLLDNDTTFTPEEFAQECFYVVCVAGFKQDTAKAMCGKIIAFISENPDFNENDLGAIYGNKLKVKAITSIWHNRKAHQKQFYSLATPRDKVEFLETLPHIGSITKYHLARNLGLNFIKYDIWIQRLGTALFGSPEDMQKVNNSKLHPKTKEYCDKMFDELAEVAGEKVGFLDVVLWRACQKGLLKIKNSQVFLDRSI
ncbi:hypothetical protein FACS1894152_4730 [Bacilli bacterium]|nr:hypothetical protein FACS1894152_4730 [Bacilli bacterium]